MLSKQKNMQAIVTPEEMKGIDAAAPESLEALIKRAGLAVAEHAVRMLKDAPSKTKTKTKTSPPQKITIVVGKGNNGADGRCAGELLKEQEFLVEYISPDADSDADSSQPPNLTDADLIIDAAYGTGLARTYYPPKIQPHQLVLAVDIPSGVDGLTGQILGGALKAQRTITFGALKPGHLLYPGKDYVGELYIDPIGLDTSVAKAWLLEPTCVADALSTPDSNTHKWKSACWVIGGSPGMTGSVSLMALAAYRTGAGYVRASLVGYEQAGYEGQILEPVEAVSVPLPPQGWADKVLAEASRFGSIVIGPGLGSQQLDVAKLEILKVLAELEKPVLIDGDGLNAIAGSDPKLFQSRKAPTILTPHDKEFERLSGTPPAADRFASVRELAAKYNSIVLLKGSTTLISNPQGEVLVSDIGDERLATAGSGDVLSGIIGALLAQGVEAHLATAAGAYIHGKAAKCGYKVGLIASDIANLVPEALMAITDGN